MRKAMIVGGSSGIGRELARLLAAEGCRVGVTGRRTDLLQELSGEYPEHISFRSSDATTEGALHTLDELVGELGGLDLLVISAGYGDINLGMDREIQRKTNRLNVEAFTGIASWGARFFEAQGHGHLLAITSIAGLRGGGAVLTYNASKAYQINFLEGLRQRAAKKSKQIFVTDIRPGFVDTDMAKGEGQFWVASPVKAARQIMRAIGRRKRVAYVTRRWVLFALVLKVMPGWLHRRM